MRKVLEIFEQFCFTNDVTDALVCNRGFVTCSNN
jgi:hypothetical protein